MIIEILSNSDITLFDEIVIMYPETAMIGRRVAATLSIVILFLCCLASPSVAQVAAPETVEIVEVQVFTHMAEPDDLLYVLRYDIDWGNVSQPLLPVDSTFDFVLYDDGAVVGNTTAPVFHNSGYNQGIVSWYFPGNTTNPSWGEFGNVTIEGSIAVFGSPAPGDTYTLTAEYYSSYISPAEIREELRQFIVAQSMFIDFDWNDFWISGGTDTREVDLLYYLQDSHTYVLSATGEAYYGLAIPDLDTYCPQLFLFNLSEWTYTEKEHSQAAKAAYEEQFAGTPIEDFKIAIAELMGGIGASTAFTIVTVLIVLVNAVYTSHKWNRIYPGILASWGTVLILTRMGLPDIAMVMLVVTAALLFALYGILLKPAQG